MTVLPSNAPNVHLRRKLAHCIRGEARECPQTASNPSTIPTPPPVTPAPSVIPSPSVIPALPPSFPPSLRHSRESGNPGWPIGHAPLPSAGGAAQAQQSAGEEKRPPATTPCPPVIPANAGTQDAPFSRHSRAGGNLAAHPLPSAGGDAQAQQSAGEEKRRGATTPCPNPSFPRTREPRTPPYPSFPRRREPRSPPHSRLREGTRKRSKARGRRSVRPQLPPPPQPVIPANAGIQDAPSAFFRNPLPRLLGRAREASAPRSPFAVAEWGITPRGGYSKRR